MDPSRTALLLLDLQHGFLGLLEDPTPVLQGAAAAAAVARRAGVGVIHLGVSFRPGQPEVSSRNTMFGRPGARDQMIAGSQDVGFHPTVTPAAEDVVLLRPRTSAFAGSALAEVLRARDVDTLVLAGTATSGAVLATACAADDLDYSVMVLRDAVADPLARVDRVLLDDVLPQYAGVSNVEEFQRELAG